MTRDGASRQFFLQEAKYVYPAGRIDPQVLSLAEPLSVVCHAASNGERMMGPLPDLRILILGWRKHGDCPPDGPSEDLPDALTLIFMTPFLSRMETAPVGLRRDLLRISILLPVKVKDLREDYRDFYSSWPMTSSLKARVQERRFPALEIVKPLGRNCRHWFCPPR